MFQVTIADFLSEPLDAERAILGDIGEVTALGATSESDLAGRLGQTDALVLYHFVTLSAPTLAEMKKCRLVVRGGVGVDNVDLGAARGLGIPVANVPDYGTEEVADSAMAMALSLGRGTHLLNSRLRRAAGPWTYTQAVPLQRLRGRVFGVIGCGRIGTAVALRAKAFGFDVRFYDPYLPHGADKALGITRVASLRELLRAAHVASLHCPLTDETHHLIDSASIDLLPDGAVLVNTARGAVADAEAVAEALGDGRLAGAGIDVLEEEPPGDSHPLVAAWRDPDHPAHDRLILNPHAAFYSEQGLADIRTKSAHNIRHTLLGEAPANVVN